MFDLNHPLFLPVWRRYATVAVSISWLLLELSRNEVFWTILAAAMSGWAIKGLLISFDEEAARAKDGKNASSADQTPPDGDK
ncbi:hypothetical protein [Flavimaricola marinus]|uniref:DUF3329 domain-containing protein n=1 Tax=Flavimaricola marinus TaxID=1819565 RepID=A0A238LDW3_9RHOB|nr:hypothetical protein [Flavimaricola marinus]SMY07614.1 hypothetical protein LOM8899_01751 [Flavimaricola marinus]